MKDKDKNMHITSVNLTIESTAIIVVVLVLTDSSREIELFLAPVGLSQRTRELGTLWPA